MINSKILVSISLIICLFASNTSYGQDSQPFNTSDSVDLSTIITKVIDNYPSVLKAQEAINSVNASIGLVRSAYLPDISLNANYTRIGPIPSISIPNMGTFDMAPADNYSTSVNVYQTIYDFSETSKKVKLAESNKEIAENNVQLVKERLSLLTTNICYNIIYLSNAVNIKEKQIEILNQHLDYVTKKKETGTATDYEILSTKVRISVAKNQKSDIETGLNNQQVLLNSLLGIPNTSNVKIKVNLSAIPIEINSDSLIDYALTHRTELTLADLHKKQSQLKLISVKAENNPVIGVFLVGGFKNGYFPDLNAPKANYSAGIALKVPIFSANRHKNQVSLASSELNSVDFDYELKKREVTTEVIKNINDLRNSLQKIEVSKLQLQQAEEARKLAELSYKAGTLTNLDLLDAESFEADSRLNLIKAQTDFMNNQAKLEISIGIRKF